MTKFLRGAGEILIELNPRSDSTCEIWIVVAFIIVFYIIDEQKQTTLGDARYSTNLQLLPERGLSSIMISPAPLRNLVIT